MKKKKRNAIINSKKIRMAINMIVFFFQPFINTTLENKNEEKKIFQAAFKLKEHSNLNK